MLKLFQLIPGVSSLLQMLGNVGLKLYSEKLKAEGAHENKVVELATRELQLDEMEARLNAQTKLSIRDKWTAPENMMFYFVALPYWFKVITVDNVIGSIWDFGLSTPALKGDTAIAMTMVMVFWFGKRGLENITTILGAAFGRK